MDIDQDGKLDIIFSGQSSEGDVFRAYKNTGNIDNFASIDIGLPAVRNGNFIFGDIFGEGRNDVIFNESTFRNFDNKTEYNTVFGKGTFDFRDLDLETEKKFIKIDKKLYKEMRKKGAGHQLVSYSCFDYYHPEIIKFIESKI